MVFVNAPECRAARIGTVCEADMLVDICGHAGPDASASIPQEFQQSETAGARAPVWSRFRG